MSLIDHSALWQALQDVDDGQDPVDVYSRVTSEPADPDDEMGYPTIKEEHPHEPCRDKWETQGYCLGNECVFTQDVVATFRCPCECHKNEEDS